MASLVNVRDVLRISRQLARPALWEIHLEPREVLALRADAVGMQILACASVLWITQDGDVDDYVLNPGERFTINRPGPVIVQGMRGA